MSAKKPVDHAIREAAKQCLDRCFAALGEAVGRVSNRRCEPTSLPLSPTGSEDLCLFPVSTNDADFEFWNNLIARSPQFTR
jgi:hypothetical protein